MKDLEKIEWSKETFVLTGKRVFVAGHGGLAGSAVVRRLAGEGCEVLSAARGDLDLRDQGAVRDFIILHNLSIVVLAAAKVGGIGANMAEPVAMLTDNILIQTNVMRAAHEAGVERLVFLGSSCIYPKDAVQPIVEDALGTGPLEETNRAYAMAKIAGIEMVQSYRRQYGSDWISLMPCNLYGPGDRFDLQRSHVIPALMMKAHAAKVSGGDFVVWGSGQPLREFMYVDDLADAIIFALKHYTGERILNVGSGEEISIGDLAVMIADVVGFRGEIVFDASKPDGVARKVLDVSRMREAGWSASTSLRDGLTHMYEWYLKMND